MQLQIIKGNYLSRTNWESGLQDHEKLATCIVYFALGSEPTESILSIGGRQQLDWPEEVLPSLKWNCMPPWTIPARWPATSPRWCWEASSPSRSREEDETCGVALARTAAFFDPSIMSRLRPSCLKGKDTSLCPSGVRAWASYRVTDYMCICSSFSCDSLAIRAAFLRVAGPALYCTRVLAALYAQACTWIVGCHMHPLASRLT
jgi:hypothetical protein